jgi:hypothetical protein
MSGDRFKLGPVRGPSQTSLSFEERSPSLQRSPACSSATLHIFSSVCAICLAAIAHVRLSMLPTFRTRRNE